MTWARPVTILVSIDGYRRDYSQLHGATFLTELARDGARAERLIPSFPTKTFPNHYTLGTGLRPEHHGIVQNSFYDRGFDAWFGTGQHPAAREGRWYGGEPIWNTLQRQGLHAACMFWPGSEADIHGLPEKWVRYNQSMPNGKRVAPLVDWLSLPEDERPDFLTL